MDKKQLVKSVFSALCATCILLAFSCTNPNAGADSEEINTLRSTADSIGSKTRWTLELEKNLLTAKVDGADGIEKAITVGPDNVFASGNEKSYEPLYPEIPGFSKLNTSSLDEGALQLLDDFCTAITTNADADGFMVKGDLYSLVLFLYDLNEADGPVFKSYILGEPFKNDDVFQCPVRFYYDSAKTPANQDITTNDSAAQSVPQGTSYEPHLDVYLYLKQDEGAWKVHQIAYDIEEQ